MKELWCNFHSVPMYIADEVTTFVSQREPEDLKHAGVMSSPQVNEKYFGSLFFN